MKLAFLLTNAYGMGGTVRTVATQANQLCQRHDVELISLNRRQDEPFFPLDPRIRVRFLHDRRQGHRPDGWLSSRMARSRSRLMHRKDGFYNRHFSLWADLRAVQALWNLDADVLITTRPAFSIFATRWAPRRVIKIAQEHSFAKSYRPLLRESIRARYPRLDCVVSLTESNAADLAELIGDPGLPNRVIPNGLETRERPVSTQHNKLVISAGRLAPGKRHHHLVRAFSEVVRAHPDWTLRIYGAGECAPRLRQQILDLELHNHVFLMGRCQMMDREFAKASISVMSSRYEAMGMTIVESMACGVPVVSYDCDHGPRAVMTSGEDGLLVRNGDPDALAAGIISLIEDEQTRRDMAKAAISTAAAYDHRAISQRWDELFDELAARRDG